MSAMATAEVANVEMMNAPGVVTEPVVAPSAPLVNTPETVKAAEKAAINIKKAASVKAAPIRQYLESTVVPILMQGMQAVCKERPDNPVEYLAYYLLQHNPQGPRLQPQAEKQAAAEAPTADK